jgi:hypothetical protein
MAAKKQFSMISTTEMKTLNKTLKGVVVSVIVTLQVWILPLILAKFNPFFCIGRNDDRNGSNAFRPGNSKGK